MRHLILAAVLAGLVVPGAAHAGAISLRVSSDDGAGHRRSATLTCSADGRRATGFLRHRDPVRLCRRAARLRAFLASSPDPARVCTEIYGGADTALIAGTIGGTRVRRAFGRADGCQLADWDRARALLPHPAGVGVR